MSEASVTVSRTPDGSRETGRLVSTSSALGEGHEASTDNSARNAGSSTRGLSEEETGLASSESTLTKAGGRDGKVVNTDGEASDADKDNGSAGLTEPFTDDGHPSGRPAETSSGGSGHGLAEGVDVVAGLTTALQTAGASKDESANLLSSSGRTGSNQSVLTPASKDGRGEGKEGSTTGDDNALVLDEAASDPIDAGSEAICDHFGSVAGELAETVRQAGGEEAEASDTGVGNVEVRASGSTTSSEGSRAKDNEVGAVEVDGGLAETEADGFGTQPGTCRSTIARQWAGGPAATDDGDDTTGPFASGAGTS